MGPRCPAAPEKVESQLRLPAGRCYDSPRLTAEPPGPVPPRVPVSSRRPTRPDAHQAPLTRAKLQVPNPDAAALERPALLELLDRHAGRPLTLLTADAGWGKTTLAAAFVRGRHRPIVWYSLLPSDGDLRVM